MPLPVLKNLAREKGLRGYSRLRKAELIQRLRAPRDQMLDQAIEARMANVPFLTPTPYTLPQATPTLSPSSNAVDDLIDYLNNVREIPRSVSPRIKKLQEDVKSIYNRMKLFKVREGNSALRNFARVYNINGIEGYDARSFLQNARKNITDVLRNNRGTKVKLIFKCNMERPGNLREMVIEPTDFHSNIEVSLDGTDEKDLNDTRVEKILENMATFESIGSGWRLYSIIQLELHTMGYNPLRGEKWFELPEELGNKTAIINMQNKDKNKDNKSFLWCVLRALNKKIHKE